ncbi:MAG: pilus assembly protein TadG-related protein [Tomitella sp.]|nr:pilus assembly protein TadG-related protein [Tomitella sp.]
MRTAMRRHLRALHRSRDRGSVSIWLATASFVMIILVGLAVDLAGQVHAQQHARDVAAQAARAGGQQLQAAKAIRGQGVYANPSQAAASARAYLAASGLTGNVSIQGGDTVVVTTTERYPTKFLGIIGLNSMTVKGKAESRVVRAVGGVER